MTNYDAQEVARIHQELREASSHMIRLPGAALEKILTEKGLVDPQSIDAWSRSLNHIGLKRGAAVVARAWNDAGFKRRLMADAPATIDELGYLGRATGHLQVVENTTKVHVVVCTLCSCYPFSILGMAPAWYKVAAYRSRAVRNPRGVLEEFGVEISNDIEVESGMLTTELHIWFFLSVQTGRSISMRTHWQIW